MKKISTIVLSALIAVTLSCAAAAAPHAHSGHPQQKPHHPHAPAPIPPHDDAVLKKLSQETEGVTLEDLRYAYRNAQKKDSIINAMNRPGEAKPWYEYRKIFIVPKRIADGKNFMKNNRAIFKKAEDRYHVAPEIVASIIGVETFYGQQMGKYRVLDALYTLGFHYPKRADYFSHEFANFVKLTKQQGWMYSETLGSYAGAMGMGQFMPWSYLKWAVDFNNDGHKDLFHNNADAIGSVANYFDSHEWHYGEPVTVRVYPRDTARVERLLGNGTKPDITVGELRKLGVSVPHEYDNDLRCKLFKFEESAGTWSYYAGFHNFYVITRYNKSPLYARAVYELSLEISGKTSDYYDDDRHHTPHHGGHAPAPKPPVKPAPAPKYPVKPHDGHHRR